MPLALREAALNGCQVMTTSLGGVREVINQLPQNAVIEVEPEVSSLKAAIRAWLNSEECSSDRLINRQREVSSVAKALWAWQSVGPQHLALFERLHAQ
jgi:glycosyltransferase involved in cell wall biosynthesis